jgi:hypothetical protein
MTEEARRLKIKNS